jgi:hypothetical protein
MAKDTKYVSEITKFINSYMEQNPKLKEKQQLLRDTWWDTNGVDLAEEKVYNESKVKLDGYAYFSYPSGQ